MEHGALGPAALPCWQPAHPPAVDAHRDPVIGLVAANVPDELQDGLDGGGHVVVWPVLVVEVEDGAGCLQERSSGRVWDVGTARGAGFLLHPQLPSAAAGKGQSSSLQLVLLQELFYDILGPTYPEPGLP